MFKSMFKNMFMHRVIAWIVLLIVAFTVSGCAEGTFHVKLHKDGSADLNYNIGVNRSMMGFLALAGDNLILEMRRDAEQEGYIVSSYSTDRMTGIKLTKKLESIESVGLDLNMFNFSNPLTSVSGVSDLSEKTITDEPRISMKEGLFYTVYHAKGNVDLTTMDLNIPSQLTQLGVATLGQINLEFILTLPIEPNKHNANEVKDGGYTLVWSLVPGENNEIEVEAKVPKVKNIILLLLLLLTVGGIGIVYSSFYKVRSGVSNAEEQL